MIFTAFDNVVGKVDDFVTMSGCWCKVLTTIEKQLNELAYLVWEHPNTEESVRQIAAIVAYDEIRAEKRRCQDGNPDQRQRKIYSTT